MNTLIISQKNNVFLNNLIRFILIVCPLFFHSCNITTIPPRPTTIPQSSLWAGGSDGGMWYDIMPTSINSARISVYWEYDGEIACDTTISFSNHPVIEREILDQIRYTIIKYVAFDGRTVFFNEHNQ